MSKELIFKKVEQIKELLDELEGLLAKPLENFLKDIVVIRASERDFQLIVELASDINTHILLEKGRKTPDSYRQSFTDLIAEDILLDTLAEQLSLTAKLRNILVHEYDFDEDYAKFYMSAKESIPRYRQYLKAVFKYTENI